jgi:hypothetical protein
MKEIIAYCLIAAVVFVVTALTACTEAAAKAQVVGTNYTKYARPVVKTTKPHRVIDRRTCWDFPACVEYNRVRYGRK